MGEKRKRSKGDAGWRESAYAKASARQELKAETRFNQGWTQMDTDAGF